MYSLPAQFSAASRDQFLAQLEFFSSLATAAIENTRQLADMQLRASQATFQRSADAVQQLINARDPRELFNANTSQAGLDHVFQFGREMFSIVTGMAAGQGQGYAPAPAAAAQPPARAEWQASQADAGQPPHTASTPLQSEDRRAFAAEPAQAAALAAAPDTALPPVAGAPLTPVADAVAQAVGKKPQAKKQ
jgi:hypothetical protein